ncbi:MAG: dihydroorotate dehydrogenase [Spirochaetes bacterium]|nr:dihydroorotate dehydrogenase [Spirochaetota bacterium]
MNPTIQTTFLGRSLASPLVLPAGILGMSAGSLRYALQQGYGLVTSKSLTLEPRSGHEGPVVAEYNGGVLNSMGLCNPGIKEGLEEVNRFVEQTGSPILVSLFATNREDFVELARRANDSAATFIELNLSCPNVMDEYGIPLSSSKEIVAMIVEAVKKVSRIPVLAKLSPNAMDVPSIAVAAEQSGADGLTLINTLGPGLLIDPYARKPILHPTYGGVSGPAIKPIALKIVFDCARRVRIPIIGMGGISTGLDAIEMLMAGATLVGVGTAIWQRGIQVIEEMNQGILQFLRTEGYSSVENLPRISKKNGAEGEEKEIQCEMSEARVSKVEQEGAKSSTSSPIHSLPYLSMPSVIPFFSGRITVPIRQVKDEGISAKTLRVDLENGSTYRLPMPGQFFMVTDYQGGEKPISVSELEDIRNGRVRVGLTIKAAGPFTRRFQDKDEGELISLRGPYGNPFSIRKGRLLLVGGGCGIAPLHFLAQALVKNGAEVTVVNGARTEKELLFSDRFASLPIRIVEVLEDRDGGRTAVDAVQELLSKETFDFVYAAGPEMMMANLRPLINRVEYEFLMERYMKCGVGICGSCTCDPSGIRLCVEGPVLSKGLVEQLTDFGTYKRDASGKKIAFRSGFSSCVRDTL